ncbi:hypothetical protein D9Q98_006662 [Chlorella vulgaris]|uniref:Major facilitator superfamily (MFS) profile domain-containing protein n=1 Tax=Chlorella vulgaris TaxID=3077 RepID=A0A9D4TKP1_CHLVU|nr:hypothetical protein D9Q98_006662 [Chlorella vulgaris]
MPVVDLDARTTQLTVDAALTSAGEFRRGQHVQLLLVGLAWCLAALHTLVATVTSCFDPLRRAGEVTCVKPDDVTCTAALANGTICTLPRETWQWAQPGGSLISEFDLVCSRRWLLYFQTSCFFIAVLAGCVAWQVSSERYGRRRLLYAGAGLCGLSAVMASTAPSLWMYLAFRCASGLGMGGMGLAAFALATEVSGPSWRAFVGLLINLFFSVGACAATLLAWWVPSWRLLTFLSGAACLAYLSTWSLVTESPQWLLLKGRKGEATAALAALAFANGTRPPEHPLADPTALLGNTQRGLRDVLGSSRLRHRLVLLGGAWFAASTSYFSLLLLADGISRGRSSSDDSVYVTLLSAFAYEVPGIAAAGLAVERAGRKATSLAAFLQAGACLIGAALSRSTAQRALVVAARFGLAASFASLYVHTAELFPVAVREHGMAASNFFARAGAAISPLFAFLQFQLRSSFVPLLVLGSLCLAAAFLAALLPETLGDKIPETIHELNVSLSLRRRRSWRVALAGMLRPSSSLASQRSTASFQAQQQEEAVVVVASQRST